LVGFLAAALLGVGGWYWWHDRHTARLPTIDLERHEAPVRDAISGAMGDVRAKPRSGATWGRLGMVLAIHDDREDARYCFQQARRLSPNEPRWPYYLGHSYLPDYEAALPFLREAAARSRQSDNPSAVLLLGEVLLLKGDLAESAQTFERILEREPEDMRAHFNLGVVCLGLQCPEKAVDHLTRSLKDPAARKKASAQLAAAHAALAARPGLTAAERLEHQTAAERFSRDAATLPEDAPWPDPYLAEVAALDVSRRRSLDRAVTLLNAGKNEEAVTLLQQIVRRYPDEDTYLELGRALIATRQYDQAEESFRQCLKIRPEHAQGHYLLGLVLFRQGLHHWNATPSDRRPAVARFQEAARHLERTIELMPTHSLAHAYRGRCLRYLDRPAEAEAALRAAIQQNPRQTDAYIFLSNLLSEQGKSDEARKVLDDARAAVPEDTNVRRALERLGKTLPPSATK
jgi:tetratricopeptide (TPR) repeat protein